jgi:hypothetical protein
MFSFVPHNNFLKTIVASIVLIWSSVAANAQTDEDAPVIFDSVYSQIDTVVVSNDSENPRFDSITKNNLPSYYPYSIPDTTLNAIRNDDAFWYANEAPKRQKPPEVKPGKRPFFLEDWFKTLLWIIIIGSFIAVLIWFLIASDVRLFRKKPKPLEEEINLALSEDIFAINYEQELQKAIAKNDFRLGVRLLYLNILRLFADNGILQYKMERTNSDYLAQLYNTAYYKNFFRLTRNFEYVWYGKFDISAEAFQMILQDYKNLKEQV